MLCMWYVCVLQALCGFLLQQNLHKLQNLRSGKPSKQHNFRIEIFAKWFSFCGKRQKKKYKNWLEHGSKVTWTFFVHFYVTKIENPSNATRRWDDGWINEWQDFFFAFFAFFRSVKCKSVKFNVILRKRYFAIYS